MKTTRIQRICLFLVLSVCFFAVGTTGAQPASASGKSVPLKGHFQGIGADFSGNLTHLGRFHGVIDNTSQPPTAVWTAANGDTVTNQTVSFEIDFTSPIEPDVYLYTQEIEITGGTGRFEGATGHASVTGTFNVATFEYDGRMRGRISKVNAGS